MSAAAAAAAALQSLLDSFSEEVHTLVEMCIQSDTTAAMAKAQGEKIFAVVKSIREKIPRATNASEQEAAYAEIVQVKGKLTELLDQFQPLPENSEDDADDESKAHHPVAGVLVAFAAAVKFYVYAEDNSASASLTPVSDTPAEKGAAAAGEAEEEKAPPPAGDAEKDAIGYIMDLPSLMKVREEAEKNLRASITRMSRAGAALGSTAPDFAAKRASAPAGPSSPSPAADTRVSRQFRVYRRGSAEEEDTVTLVKSIINMDRTQLQEITEEEWESRRSGRVFDDRNSSQELEALLEEGEVAALSDQSEVPGQKYLDVEFVVLEEGDDEDETELAAKHQQQQQQQPQQQQQQPSPQSQQMMVPTKEGGGAVATVISSSATGTSATGDELIVFYSLFYSDPRDSPLSWVLDSKGYKEAMKSRRPRSTSQNRLMHSRNMARRSMEAHSPGHVTGKRSNSRSSNDSMFEHDVGTELSDASTEPLTPVSSSTSGSFGAATGAALQAVSQSLLTLRKRSRQTMIVTEGDQIMMVMGMSSEDDRYRVRAATIEMLIERLANEEVQDIEYVRTFLLTYRTFLTPTDLLSRLTERYRSQNSRYITGSAAVTAAAMAEAIPAPLRGRESEDGAMPNKPPGWFIQYRIINILKKWMELYWFDFEGNEQMVPAVQHFIKCVSTSPLDNLASELEQLVARLRTESVRSHDIDPYVSNPTNPQPKSAMPRRMARMKSRRAGENRTRISMFGASLSSDFLDLEITGIARQLTMIDFEFFRRIDRSEIIRLFLSTACGPDVFYLLPPSNRLSAYAARFNRVSFWVATEIITMPNLRQRVQVLGRFIRLAKLLSEFNNYNGMMAVLSGLQNAAVYRLKKTWAALPQQHHITLANLKRVMSFDGNYFNYRLLLNRDFPQFIPFMGLFLKDITFIADGNATFLEGENEHSPPLVNFTKFWKVSQAIENLLRFQRGIYYMPYHPEAYRFCSNLQCLDEDALYEYSLLCEPRVEK